MKIIFLDLDGVINSQRTWKAFGSFPFNLDTDLHKFDPVAIALIQRLVRETDAKVVISSTWRHLFTYQEIGKTFNLPTIGQTPDFRNTDIIAERRGHEIQDWLNNNKDTVTKYIIIDDCELMLSTQNDNYVAVDEFLGFTLEDYNRAKKLLND